MSRHLDSPPPSVFTADSLLPSDASVEPFLQLPPFVIKLSTLNNIHYKPSNGLFGTAGDPDKVENWREHYTPIIASKLEHHGLRVVDDTTRRLGDRAVTEVCIYNPQVKEWTPECAVRESLELARGASITAPVLDTTDGHGTLAETGFAALSGTLREHQVSMFFESGIGLGDQVHRARALTTMLAEQTVKDFPYLGVKIAKEFDDLINYGVDHLVDFARGSSFRMIKNRELVIPQRVDLKPKVGLVGSGAQRYSDSWYEGMSNRLNNLGLPRQEIFSAYKDDWTIDDAEVELYEKTNDAVVLFAITEDEDSFGAMGELGWLITYCMLNGQKLGIYVEKHKSDPKSDQNRQRTLAMKHLGRLLADFPDIPVFIAPSPQKLAEFGAIELQKYKQKILPFKQAS